MDTAINVAVFFATVFGTGKLLRYLTSGKEIKQLRADKAELLKAMGEIRLVAMSAQALGLKLKRKIAESVDENNELQETNRQLEAQIKMLKGGK